MKTPSPTARGVRRAMGRSFRWTLKSVPDTHDQARAAVDGSNDCGCGDCAGCAVTPLPADRIKRERLKR